MVSLKLIAECARMAEGGQGASAAARLLADAEDSDFSTLKGVMRYSALDDAAVEAYHEHGAHVVCIRVERLGEFWLAPLESWYLLPSGATIISPRGLRDLGKSLVEAVA